MDTTKKEQFERVSSIMLNTFPELRDSYNEVMEVSGGRIPGLHIILGDVLNPFIRQHLYVMTEQKILEKVFAFVEDLVTNEDEYISNAGEVSVCEGIVFYGPEIYNKALLYALPETKKSLQKLNEYYNSSPT